MKNRSCYWDNLKGILILLVVIAHFMQCGDISLTVYNAIYLFHMPLFIYVSGLFHNNENIKQRLLGLLLIGVVYNAALILVDNVILKTEQEFYILRATKIPWFVLTLAMCAAATYVLKDCNRRVVLGISLFLAIIACYDKNLMQYMALAKFIGWFPFYYLGANSNFNDIETKFTKVHIRVLGGVGVIAYIISVIMCRNSSLNISRGSFLFGVQNVFPTMSIKWVGVKIGYYLLVVVISMAVMSSTPHKNIPLLTYVGRKTMPIYFWHIIIRSFAFYTGVQNYFYASFWGNIAWTIISVAMALILTLKPFEFPTRNILEGVKNRVNYKD